MNDIQKENNTKLLEYLESRDIESVLFDVDNTLLATTEYYRAKTSELGKQLAPKIDSEREPLEISKEIDKCMYTAYVKDKRKPRLIDDRYISGLREYLGSNISREMEDYVIDYFKDFYSKSPTPFESTPVVLKTFYECNIKIVLHSHAQKEWTEIKVNLLEDLVGFKLPYLSTPIDEEKNAKSWLMASELIGSNPNRALVVGDNFDADILPSIKAGSKSLAWMDRYKVGMQENVNIEDDVELIVINDIKDLIDTLSNQS